MSWDYPHTVKFQQYVEVPDGGGGYTEDWQDFLTTEAHVQPVGSDEVVQAMQLTNPINHNIFYPYQTGIKGHMRALWIDRGESIDGVMEYPTLELRSNPLDQGGLGEVMMIKAELK